MTVPTSLSTIPQGLRIVVRIREKTGLENRDQYRDFVGHVLSSTDDFIIMQRDASANGTRPSQIVTLRAHEIVRIKPVPERRTSSKHQS